MRDPAPTWPLVPCAGCRATLVTPGRVCFDCRRDMQREERRRAEDRERLVMPAKPKRDNTAAHRRVGGDGRRWR